ncbi:methyltransferase domain-containing protein [Pseudomonas syringae group genomosp. 3]|uniref:Methylase involved in ubiquinone/menaquinone biosynthesi n=1 Tax=Pseudomonas syringae pv. primulae TaxID=251707 RepID=A0A3M3Y7A5_9PSED|nr:methyltransferase domain-containing protein [Pseudomonas syringae group genomosp. 3]RMO78220.1 Methylase involved in ubiquinone/menaquinone biosynthesi [Pseudomonas syringae pv. primulae]
MNDYLLGHSPQELERLTLQARALQPTTARLLSESGLEKGMRVLDLGCGPGDVAILAATMVGTSGEIVGIDRSEEAVALATYRASLSGLQQIRFQTCDIYDFSDKCPFDFVIGRYVMVHQADPTAFLRKSASLVRPGGVLALHEVLLSEPLIESSPKLPLLSDAAKWILAALQAGIPNHSCAERMIEHFFEAGLPQPKLSCERPTGGGEDSLLYGWTSETLKSIFPHLIRMGLVSPKTEHLDTFESRLREQALRARAQILGPTQITAWVKLESSDD